MLRLTSLATDIIEAILRGDLSRRRGSARRNAVKTAANTGEPEGPSLEKLRKNLPVRWEEQRKCWMKG